MQDNMNKNKSKEYVGEIDLMEVINVFLAQSWFMISFTSFFLVIGVTYSLFLPNTYEAKAILVSSESSNSISTALNNYSGLAGLAGISLPSPANESNSSKAIQKIQTLSFFENNVLPNIFLPDLMALKSWNSKNNSLVYDKNIYDIKSNTWIKDNSITEAPTPQKSFKKFKSDHISVSENLAKGTYALSIKHQSPFIAKKWADLVFEQVNEFYRDKDKSESEKAVEYLNYQISTNNLSEVKQVIADLLPKNNGRQTYSQKKRTWRCRGFYFCLRLFL